MTVRIGVIASSGGGAFQEVFRILQETSPELATFSIVTDRSCGMEAVSAYHNLPHKRIEVLDDTQFSRQAKAFFDETGGVDAVLLFYVRLITPELFHHYAAFNLHPSLLPAFKGFHAIRRAMEKRARFLGATLHLVTEQPDDGPIIAQTVMPLPLNGKEEYLNKCAFIQKVYLALLLIDLLTQKALAFEPANQDCRLTWDYPATDRCNPILQNSKLLQAVLDLQAKEGMEVIR